MGSYKEHQNLIKTFKLEMSQKLPKIRIFDRYCGMLYTKTGRPIKIGTKGQSDCYGMYPSKLGIILIEYEFKTGNSKQSKEQKIWQKFIESRNGIYIIVRDDYHYAIDKTKEYLIEKGIM